MVERDPSIETLGGTNGVGMLIECSVVSGMETGDDTSQRVTSEQGFPDSPALDCVGDDSKLSPETSVDQSTNTG
jgi:hypothetical protein